MSHFDKCSDFYKAGRPGYPEELFGYLHSLCEDHELAWDAGCGTGQATVALAKYFRRVIGTDISHSQIGNAEKHERVEYSVQPAEKTDIEEGSVDLVTVATALHWFEHHRFWREVKRVLKPEGVFAAWGYSWFKIDEKLDHTLKKVLLEKIEPFWPEKNKLLWDGYRGLEIPLEKISGPTYRLILNWNFRQLFQYLESWSAVDKAKSEYGSQFIEKVKEDVLSAWGDEEEEKEVSMDVVTTVHRNV